MTTTIKIVHTNIHGAPVGEDHHWTVHPDTVVDRARAMRRDGMSYRAIGAALGVHFGVVWAWVAGKRRRPPARVIARRIRPEQSAVNHQQTSADPVPMRVPDRDASADTAKNTDIESPYADLA